MLRDAYSCAARCILLLTILLPEGGNFLERQSERESQREREREKELMAAPVSLVQEGGKVPISQRLGKVRQTRPMSSSGGGDVDDDIVEARKSNRGGATGKLSVTVNLA